MFCSSVHILPLIVVIMALCLYFNNYILSKSWTYTSYHLISLHFKVISDYFMLFLSDYFIYSFPQPAWSQNSAAKLFYTLDRSPVYCSANHTWFALKLIPQDNLWVMGTYKLYTEKPNLGVMLFLLWGDSPNYKSTVPLFQYSVFSHEYFKTCFLILKTTSIWWNPLYYNCRNILLGTPTLLQLVCDFPL